jgi:ABC-type multidrug transport system fused ATPase/permease subunit
MFFKILNQKDLALIKRALKYIKPYKVKFSLAFLCILSGIGFGLIQPLIWAKLLVNLFNSDFKGVMLNIVFITALYVFQSAISFAQSYLFSFLSENIIFDLKQDIYKKILELPIKAFDEMRVGDFISRLHGDVSGVANIITRQLLNMLVNLIKVIAIGIVVFSISLPLGLIILISFPFNMLVFIKYGKQIRKRNEELLKTNDSYFSHISQSIFGIREVRSLGISESIFNTFLRLTGSIKNKNIKISILNSFSQSISQSISFLADTAILAAGGFLIYLKSLSMEYFIAFSSYSKQFSSALMGIAVLNSELQQILASLERLFHLMDNLNYTNEGYGKVVIGSSEGNIEFKDVSFNYNKDNEVLRGISFSASRNKKIAFVGTSGSGKTTIFNLLLRFYRPSSGEILIDGVEIGELDENSLRSNISIVSQEPFLFNMTIKDGLRIAKPSASEEEIHNACKSAYIHEFIMSLPEKYDSVLGENAVNLSGGQKQRIAIARALLKKSRIILFDEATSSLDNESQYHIRNALNEIAKDRTILIIAHRLFTVIDADEIIVINDGKIAGQGTHKALIKKNAIYQHLYETELSILTASQEVV